MFGADVLHRPPWPIKLTLLRRFNEAAVRAGQQQDNPGRARATGKRVADYFGI